MKKLNTALGVAVAALFLVSCGKDDTSDPRGSALSNEQIQQNILNDFSYKVAFASYLDMETRMNIFYSQCIALDTNPDQTNLDNCRAAWKDVRGTWEQAEAFLFGPVVTNNIDPSTDTWPVDYNALD